ncbi:hypothetical protein ACFQHW_01600 [Lapidilactobacillus achengensis]|uniref:Uncharacterized protein n=1 Tax=Lapidilactobacillus achengensis TaxID=2486000 RepID=A0ABW1UMH4_9LACO|nr:hypothetical protein [Lapidilactobacillus achengensis]
MPRRGLLIMTLGFLTIMISPAGPGATDIRSGIMFTGLIIAALGFWLFRHDSKVYSAKVAEENKKADAEYVREHDPKTARPDDADVTTTEKKGTKK